MAAVLVVAFLGPLGARPSPAAAATTGNPGEPCVGNPRGVVDSSGRPVQCLLTSAGRVWGWSGVPSDLALVPASWSAVMPIDTGANADAPEPALPGQYVNRAAMEARLVGLANDARRARGLPALVVDPRLTRLSRWWAATTGQPAYAGRGTSHCPANVCSKRAAEIGYPSFGEVIRPWNPFPSGDMADERFFVDSPRHMAILTNPKVTHIGYGVHIVGDAANPQSVVVVGQVGRAR